MGPADSRTASTHHPDRNALALDSPEPANRRHVTRNLDRRLESLPDWHPSSPRYADQVRPLTDAEHADHITDVQLRRGEARAAGAATDRQHTLDVDREIWSHDRRVSHDSIIEHCYLGASDVPCDG